MSTELNTAVIVALDHGLHWGEFEGFEDRRATLESVLEGRPDAVLASVPFLDQYQDLLDEYPSVDRIGTLDIIHDSTIPGHQGNAEIHRQAFSLAEAARVGADVVKTCLVYGRDDPDVLGDNLEFAAQVAENGRDHDLSVMLEPVLWGPQIEDNLDGELIGQAARVTSELGPDVLKLYYPGDEGTFAAIVDRVPCPVYVAGGPKADDERDVLEMTESAVGAGANGPVYGRNVWQHEDPAAMVTALRDIAHSGATASQALERFE